MNTVTCPNCSTTLNLQCTVSAQIPVVNNKDGATLLCELAAGPLPIGERTVCTPDEAAEILIPMIRDARKEHFIVLYLDARRRLAHVETVSVGTLSSTLVHPREVFQPAIACSAASILIAHNHPSGDPNPSDEDHALTRRLRDAGRLLGIEVVDHIIVGKPRKDERGFSLPGWVSLRQMGDL